MAKGREETRKIKETLQRRPRSANIGGQTEFYHNNSTIVNGKTTYTVFSMTDQAEHARMKRPIVKYYSLSHVLGVEPHLDTVITDLLGHLDRRFANTDKECDLGAWIAFCKTPITHLPYPFFFDIR
jgi:hypothetical protein